MLSALLLAALSTPQLDFHAVALETLERAGFEGGRTPTLAEFFDSAEFFEVRLGGLDLRLPVEPSRNKGKGEELSGIARDLLRMQASWVRWLAGPEAELEAFEEDVETLDKYAKGWGYRDFGKADPEGEFHEELKARPKEREAALRFAAALTTDVLTGVARPAETNTRLVLASTREDYLRYAAVAGYVSAQDRPRLWHDSQYSGMAFWAGTFEEPILVVALEYAPIPIDEREPMRGSPMHEASKTRQSQHAVDRGAAALLRGFFYVREHHFFESSLASILVVEGCGENDLGMQGYGSEYARPGSSTPPYERFVPGGNPGGGILPPRGGAGGGGGGSARNLPVWFKERGSDYYVKALRTSQKEGGQMLHRVEGLPEALAKDKTAHFEVVERGGGGRTIVSAPFFGPAGEDKPLPPEEFLDDYEDFFAAYKASFFHWMWLEGAGEDSEARFSQLLRRLLDFDELPTFDAAVEEVYGLPLSAADGATDSLEWRFLSWLAKRR